MSLEKILVDDFEILQNGDEYAISFQLDDGMVFDADFVYDGRNCAILTRNKTKAFLLINILPTFRKKLSEAKSISVFEEKGKEVVNAYEVEIKHVDNIPYPDNFEKDTEDMLNKLKEDLGEQEYDELVKGLVKIHGQSKK